MKSALLSHFPELIGVIHLPPLPGSPGASSQSAKSTIDAVIKVAVEEAALLEKNGFEGLIIENFGDAPFYKSKVPPETIASMSIIVSEVRKRVQFPVGVNVLRNDSFAALAIAAVTGANFIRVNVLSGVVATDQGVIEGNAADLLRERIRLNATEVAILADVQVKHGVTLSSTDPYISIEENVQRGGANGIIITGATTGRSPEAQMLDYSAKMALKAQFPLYIGSGITPDAIRALKHTHIRAIVGSCLRKNGQAGMPLEETRVKDLVQAWRQFKAQ